MTTDLYAPLGFPELQFLDDDGVVLSAGTVTTYSADGVTLKSTWKDPLGGAVNTNPVVLDSAGRGVFWGDGDYVFGVFDALGNQVYTKPIATPNAQLGISTAMLPVVQASTTTAALALLGGEPVGSGSVPVGGMVMWTSSIVPTGWLACIGQALSRTTYSTLFSLFGTAFGSGNGTTTFNLPDLRSRLPLGLDLSGSGRVTDAVTGVNPAVLGDSGGDQNVGAHTHAVTDPGHSHTVPGNFTNSGGTGNLVAGGVITAATPVTSSDTTGLTVASGGTGTGANLPPVLVLNYIIFTGVS